MAGAEKLSEYQGVVGRVHALRDSARTRWAAWKESRQDRKGLLGLPLGPVRGPPKPDIPDKDRDYSHIYRRKTFWQLVRVSCAVCGIEFSYAAETAFVSPTLLVIGVRHSAMSLVWALSPLVGFFLTPLLGSLSDRCRSRWGRRRPFIALLAGGVLAGLILVPNGAALGYLFGDPPPPPLYRNITSTPAVTNSTSSKHPWGVFFTIVGTVLLDFDADACQSPARAYLLDVTVPEDHARGLSTFTIMAGLGGFMGYALGGINWDATLLGWLLGGHVRAVFTLITFIFVACVSYTITSFREIPLDVLEGDHIQLADYQQQVAVPQGGEEPSKLGMEGPGYGYGTLQQPQQQQTATMEKSPDLLTNDSDVNVNGYVNYGYDDGYQRQAETAFNQPNIEQAETVPVTVSPHTPATLRQYLLSIVFMPHSLRVLCLTNLFCWMAHVCYSLYFTDFVGEAVFGGDPQAEEGSPSRELYEEGVRFGCWGMSMYSLSCACYSFIIERLINRFRALRVYVGGLLVYSTGMALMAIARGRVGVILFSWTAGVMYSTLFTMPYLLVAHYHASGTFDSLPGSDRPRGLGTDVAVVSSMVFLAQFALSVGLGSIVSWAGSTTAVVVVASLLALCGAVSASQVVYLDL